MGHALLIPKQQPYNIPPWNYDGNETVVAIPPNIVDWVLVTLRKDLDPLNPNSTTAIDVITKAAFINTLGKIVCLDGLNPIFFNIPKDKYYIIIQHRNHLGVMSSIPILIN